MLHRKIQMQNKRYRTGPLKCKQGMLDILEPVCKVQTSSQSCGLTPSRWVSSPEPVSMPILRTMTRLQE